MGERLNTYFRDSHEKAGANISWAAIFAGTVTFLGIFLLLSFIGTAIGFGKLDPTAANPTAGVGTGLLIWTVISLLLSFIAAGFIAGVTSQRVGLVHGFLTWALTTIILIFLIVNTTISAVAGVGRLFGTVASATGTTVATVAEGAGNAVAAGVEQAAANLNVNTDDLKGDMEKALRDTEVPELQPEYLQSQMDAAVEDIKKAAKDLATNPQNHEATIEELTGSLKNRAETIGQNVDRDAIAKAVAKNSDLSKEEADQVTDNIYNGYQKASKEIQVKIDQASQAINDAQAKIQQGIQDAREAGRDASNAVAGASVWAFVGLLIGLLLTSYFGLLGSRVGSDVRVKRDA